MKEVSAMKIDAIARFTMGNTFELTQVNPVGLLMVDTDEDRYELLRSLCQLEIEHNIILYDDKGCDAPRLAGANLMYKSTRTKDVFNKLDETNRFVQATGCKVPVFVIFDALSINNLVDINVQNDLLRLLARCKYDWVRILFIMQETEPAYEETLRMICKGSGIGPLTYEMLKRHNERILIRDFERSVNMTSEHPAILFKTEADFRTVNLLYDGERIVDNIGRITCLSQVNSVLSDLRHPTIMPDCKVYVIELNNELYDSQQLESLLREGKLYDVRFALIGYVPLHLAALVTVADDTMK